MAFAGWYNSLDRLPYIGDVCLVAKVGLGGPEFTDWGKQDQCWKLTCSRPMHQNVRKMLPHTKAAHER
jgi:hypothetical protein